jgi:hypothetical protein
MLKKKNYFMHNKILFSILLGILVVGITEITFAEEEEKTSFIAVDEEKFEQPKSMNSYQEITIIGYVEDYSRGEPITITITHPDKSLEEINTYASKKGEIYTLLHITQDSQIGVHLMSLSYNDNLLSTSFEILESPQ